MVACTQTGQRHGETLAAVLDVGTALSPGDTAVVIEGVGDGEIPWAVTVKVRMSLPLSSV